MPRKGPLDGITVLDLSSFIFGPYVTQTLGDLGADVIKIETPEGDGQRIYGQKAEHADLSSAFLPLNRNKRSVVLDLKSEKDRERLRAQIPGAQVFVNSLRSEAVAKLGFSYDDVAKLNPSIVYLHCTGYGSDGPYAGRLAMDDLVQGVAGAGDLTRRVYGDREMRLMPMYMADKISGLHGAYAVLAALFHRERTGEGQFVEVPMFEAVTNFILLEHIYGAAFDPPVSLMGFKPALNPQRKAFASKDGYMVVQYTGQKAAARFLELGGIENAHESERFLNAAGSPAKTSVYYELMETAARSHTTEEWMKLGEENHIPIMRANSLDDLLDDPHLKAVDFFQVREHPAGGKWRAMQQPVKFSKTPASIRRDPPRIGADNDAI